VRQAAAKVRAERRADGCVEMRLVVSSLRARHAAKLVRRRAVFGSERIHNDSAQTAGESKLWRDHCCWGELTHPRLRAWGEGGRAWQLLPEGIIIIYSHALQTHYFTGAAKRDNRTSGQIPKRPEQRRIRQGWQKGTKLYT
jgi:hypothetical protein